MEELENCYSVKILMYSLNENGTVNLIYNSLNKYVNKMFLNISRNYLSYITNFNRFANNFECNKLFKREWNMKQHYNICYNRTKYMFPGGFYSLPVTIFEKLRTLNINVPKN